ncbi:MAG: PepSY domain-containing protein [Rhodospirillaceae bacterium]|nr:PepSY domain-containing protein [Rhodospirillaceae bacterium]
MAVAALLPPASPVLAEDADEDHETARKALENKEILPLGQVLALIEGQYQGDVIEIELERKKGIWVYELDLIDAGGRVREIYVDARNGEVLKVEFEE